MNPIVFLTSEGTRCCAPNQTTTPSVRAQCRRSGAQTARAAGNTHPTVFLLSLLWLVGIALIALIPLFALIVLIALFALFALFAFIDLNAINLNQFLRIFQIFYSKSS
jgi:hypothetical protein